MGSLISEEHNHQQLNKDIVITIASKTLIDVRIQSFLLQLNNMNSKQYCRARVLIQVSKLQSAKVSSQGQGILKNLFQDRARLLRRSILFRIYYASSGLSKVVSKVSYP